MHSNKVEWVGYQVIEGIGLGMLFTAPELPILAPLPVTETAHALAFFAFVRCFAQTSGVTIGAMTLQNQLKKKLPRAFLEGLGSSVAEITYAAIPAIRSLEEPTKTEVKQAVAASILFVLGMKELKMHEVTDEDWGLKEEKKKMGDVETPTEKPL
ncbi:hypothetical protein FS837_009018 [Tulasnella sp. UAMH 9824]|nr:hypothetical protein FS837_009018 [Tulasnella sp. UAMH 9824]